VTSAAVLCLVARLQQPHTLRTPYLAPCVCGTRTGCETTTGSSRQGKVKRSKSVASFFSLLAPCFFNHTGQQRPLRTGREGAEARFALLCQCSLPASSLRALRSSLYFHDCWLSSDLHSFRFCARRVLTCPGLPGPHRDIVPQWRGIVPNETLQESTRATSLHWTAPEGCAFFPPTPFQIREALSPPASPPLTPVLELDYYPLLMLTHPPPPHPLPRTSSEPILHSRAPSAIMHTALLTPIAASLAMDASTITSLALLTPSRQGALEVVAVRRRGAVNRII
jgi:hypothetical protein